MLDPKEVSVIAAALSGASSVFALAAIDPSVDELPGVRTARMLSGSNAILLHHVLNAGLLSEDDLIEAMISQGFDRERSVNYVEFVFHTPPLPEDKRTPKVTQ